jgi:hypothetical protein
MIRLQAIVILLAVLTLAACGDDTTDEVVPITNDTASDTASSDDAGTDTSEDITDVPEDSAEPDITEPEPDAGPPPCVAGLDCDDENPCTLLDQCLNGFCVGEPYECDDGRACTSDECDGDGGCIFAVSLGYCLIGNQCIDHSTANPDNSCERCDTDENRIWWTVVADSSPCDDFDNCTIGDYCNSGNCVAGLDATCDDDNVCTEDSCDPSIACINVPISGDCDDGDKCTVGEACSGGVCQSVTANCDDNNPCTTDTCVADLGCQHVNFVGPCDDGDECTENESCASGECQGGQTVDCADGQQCTFDQCDPAFGCWYALNPSPCCTGAVSLCDDGDPCTLDDCDETTFECSNVVTALPCEDGDICTVGDICVSGECESGGIATCNDGNPCTDDSCDSAAGCQNVATLGTCDDGIECTTNDICVAGECVGDASECGCSPDFAATAAKATALTLIAEDDGLDIDQNPSTCSPTPCSDGIDNSLSGLAGLINPSLETELNNGGLILLFELVNPTFDGSAFELRLYAGRKAGGGCSVQSPGCSFLVDDATLNEDCGPAVTLDNATIVGGKLTAGGPSYNFPLQLPLFGDTYLSLDLFSGTIEGDITINGDDVTIQNAILAGAVPKQTFVTAIEFVPESQLPVPKATIVQLLDLVVINDIDTTPPAGADAASIAMSMAAVPATIVGVAD